MRILVVQESDWLEKGPHQSHHLMERMAENGHKVMVIDHEISWRTQHPRDIFSRKFILNDVKKTTEAGGVVVIRPPFIRWRIIDYISIAVSHAIEISRQIRDFAPDVIVGFGILNATIARHLSRKVGIPFVYYVIDELHRLTPDRQLTRVAKMLESHNMRTADLVLSINEGLREYTVEMGASASRTQVLKAGVDFTRFRSDVSGASLRQRLGIADDRIVLFFMGWLYEFSGLRELCDELMSDLPKYNRLTLLIVGKGELTDYLNSASSSDRAGGRIIIQGWQPYEMIPEYIAASDICILPSLKHEIVSNIVPIKLYEYMAMGKPVIATDHYGIHKEFGDGNGIIYVDTPEDVPGIALLIDESRTYRQIGDIARSRVEANDWKRIADRFEQILEGACKID